MIKKIKASLELQLFVMILSFFIIGLGVYGFQEIKKISDNSQELYVDRMLPMHNLADIRYYSTSMLYVINQVKTKQITCKEASQKIKQSQDSIAYNWKIYTLTYLTPKEKKIADATSELLKKSNAVIEKLKAILVQEDIGALDNTIEKELNLAINPVIVKATMLMHLQIQLGNNLKAHTFTTYTNYTNRIFYILIVVFAFAIPFTYYLMRKNKAIIDGFNLSNDQLIASENNYRKIIEFAGEAILILDKATQIIDLNDISCELFGYSREDLLQMEISRIILPKELKKQTADIANVRENKFGITYRTIVRKDGAKLEAEITTRLMENKGFFCIIRDITERKKTERIIRESEKKYRHLFNNNPAYIIIMDLETLEIKEVNDAVYKKYGFSKEEWSLMTIFDYCHAEEHQKIKDFVAKILNNEANKSMNKKTWRHLKKDGEEMLMKITSHKIVYNGQQAILSLGQDVTKQVKAEAELAERDAQLNLFIEHSPAALAMFDNEMRYIARSHRWMSDYDLGNQNIIGKSHYEVFSDISEDWRAIHKRCLEGTIEKKDEDLFVRADGSMQWQKWEIHPWYKAAGEIGGIIMFTEVITEQKKATEMFKNQFDNAPDTILYINRQLKIEAINRNSPDMSKEELVGMDCISILPEESRKIAKDAIIKCFETGDSQEIESALSYGRWVRSRFVPIFNNGQITHVIVFSTDLTERRKAEEKLLISEEKHRVLTENISDAILLINQNFELEYQSLSAERISGYSPKEAMHKSIFNFMHPDEYEKVQDFLKESLNSPGIPMQNQFRVIHKEGYTIWIEGTIVNLLENKNIGAFIVNYREITNRKKFEEEQAFTASIVNSSDDGIISKNVEGIITSWNLGAEKILGYTAAETIGRHISMLVPFELRSEHKKILETVRNGNSVDHYETQRKKKGEEIIDVSLTISPIRDTLGNIVGASKIMRDITERKKFENDLIHYNAELKKINSELDRFVYSASHDLRAPLKSMLGLISVTREDVGKDIMLDSRLSMLENSVVKLDDFIEEILNYSRNARVELDKDVIDFEKLISDIRLSHKFMDNLKDLDVQVIIDSKAKFISDKGRINIILNNIFSNAIKYRDSKKRKSFVKISVICNKTNAIIVFEDNGIGVSARDKNKVFEMFYRATDISTGSGLGLYIVKETLGRLGGKIEIESEIDKGTKLIIEIPNQIDHLN